MQELTPVEFMKQSARSSSDPEHCKLSSQILSVPSPKLAFVNATAPAIIKKQVILAIGSTMILASSFCGHYSYNIPVEA